MKLSDNDNPYEDTLVDNRALRGTLAALGALVITTVIAVGVDAANVTDEAVVLILWAVAAVAAVVCAGVWIKNR